MINEEEHIQFRELVDALELHLRKSTFDFISASSIQTIKRQTILNIILNSYMNALFSLLTILSKGNQDMGKYISSIIDKMYDIISAEPIDNQKLH